VPKALEEDKTGFRAGSGSRAEWVGEEQQATGGLRRDGGCGIGAAAENRYLTKSPAGSFLVDKVLPTTPAADDANPSLQDNEQSYRSWPGSVHQLARIKPALDRVVCQAGKNSCGQPGKEGQFGQQFGIDHKVLTKGRNKSSCATADLTLEWEHTRQEASHDGLEAEDPMPQRNRYGCSLAHS
jgi:hypothetical protein